MLEHVITADKEPEIDIIEKRPTPPSPVHLYIINESSTSFYRVVSV